MLLNLPDQAVDYLYKLLLTRPMGEVEALVLAIREQAATEAKAIASAVKPNADTQEPAPSLN